MSSRKICGKFWWMFLCLVFSYNSVTCAIGNTNGTEVVVPSSVALPTPGGYYIDPDFGTRVRRLTGATTNSGGFSTQIYSQLQAFSDDNAYILLIRDGGYEVVRMSDITSVSGLDTSEWNCPRWQPSLDHTLVHYDSNADDVLRIQYTDVDTLITTNIFTFPAPYERIRGNQSFDELSEDGRWMSGMASTSDGDQYIFVVDLVNRALTAQISLTNLYNGACTPDPTWGIIEPDWIGVSPLGNYLVVQWPADGMNRCNGLETFSIQDGTFIGRACENHQHGDLGFQGTNEFLMTYDVYNPGGTLSICTRALPGTATVSPTNYILTLDWNGDHLSCRGPAGVGLVTTLSDTNDGWSALEGEVFLLNTSGQVVRLAHHQSSDCGYWVQPRASLSRDGRYVIFASDFAIQTGTNGCSLSFEGAGEAYLIDLLDPTNLVDGDGDQIGDIWEMQNFVSIATSSGASDSDNDGMSDQAEFVTLTQPTNSTSYLQLTTIDGNDPFITLSFISSTGVQYRLEYADQAPTGSWSQLSLIPGTGSSIITNTMPGTNRMFRLRASR